MEFLYGELIFKGGLIIIAKGSFIIADTRELAIADRWPLIRSGPLGG